LLKRILSANLLTEIEEQKQIINTNQSTISNLNLTVDEQSNNILLKETVINELKQQVENMYTEEYGYWIKINQPCEFVITNLESNQ